MESVLDATVRTRLRFSTMVVFVYVVKARACEARKIGSSPIDHPNATLAQRLAHLLDMQEVTGPSPVGCTNRSVSQSAEETASKAAQ